MSGFPQKSTDKENGINVGKIISVKNKSLLAMIKIEFVENSLKSKKHIETDDTLITRFCYLKFFFEANNIGKTNRQKLLILGKILN